MSHIPNRLSLREQCVGYHGGTAVSPQHPVPFEEVPPYWPEWVSLASQAASWGERTFLAHVLISEGPHSWLTQVWGCSAY